MTSIADNLSDRSSQSGAKSVGSASSVRGGAFLRSGTGSRGRRSTDGNSKLTSNAKAALLAVMEVQNSLNQHEDECKRTFSGSISAMPDWKITAQAADEDVACTEFTSPPSRSSSCMLGAASVKPFGTELDVDFDSHELGFWGDVGVKSNTNGCETIKDDVMLAISEENVMPWDL